MAEIDRLWCGSYKDYLDLVEWVKDKSFLSPMGNRIVLSDYVWKLSAEEFEGANSEHKRSVAAFSEMCDVWLIQYCPLEWVHNELRTFNYSEEHYLEMKRLGMDWFEKVTPSSRNKIVVVKREQFAGNYPWKSKEERNKKKGTFQNGWMVDVEGFNYNENTRRFYSYGSGEPWTCSDWHTKKNLSLRSVIRVLLKQGLPTGTIIRVRGRYVGEDWTLKVL